MLNKTILIEEDPVKWGALVKLPISVKTGLETLSKTGSLKVMYIYFH